MRPSLPRTSFQNLRSTLVLSLTLSLAACGGGGGGASVPNPVPVPVPPVAETESTFLVGGTLAGLRAGASLTLLNNGADALVLDADGGFTFSAPVAGAYAVTVGAPPAWHDCTVANGSGTATADVTNVSVTCTYGATVSTVAASLGLPAGAAVDAAGNIYVAEWSANRLSMVTPAGVVTSIASGLSSPMGVAVGPDGAVYVSDSGTNRILRVGAGNVATVFAGSGAVGGADGTGAAATFNRPYGIAFDRTGHLYVAEFQGNRIRKITPAGEVSTLAGSGTAAFADGTGTAASFRGPAAVAVDAAGNVYVGDASNHRIRKITAAGVVTTLAGTGAAGGDDGPGAAATFNMPFGAAFGPDGALYVAELSGHRVRRVSVTGEVSTLAGTGVAGNADGDAATATLDGPVGLAFDGAANLYVATHTGSSLRRISR